MGRWMGTENMGSAPEKPEKMVGKIYGKIWENMWKYGGKDGKMYGHMFMDAGKTMDFYQIMAHDLGVDLGVPDGTLVLLKTHGDFQLMWCSVLGKVIPPETQPLIIKYLIYLTSFGHFDVGNMVMSHL